MNRSISGTIGRSISGTDFLQLSLAAAPPGGLATWLAEQLRAAISDGRLPVGSRLPATRILAAELRVSRGVVTEAYQRLTEDGHIAGHGRAGTIVVAAPLDATPPKADLTTQDASPPADDRPPGAREMAGAPGSAGVAGAPARGATGKVGEAVGGNGSPPGAGVADLRGEVAGVVVVEPGLDVFDAMRAAPARLDLTPGVPDLAAFPRTAWLKAERAVLADLSAAEFGYGEPAGTPRLRRAVATWLARNRGIKADPDDLIIVAGVAQALGLIAQVLKDEGTTELAVEDPGSLGSRQHLQNHGMRTTPIPVDSDGLRVDELRATGARAVLATPAHQFPMGVVLGGERRRQLIQWAAEGGLIVEDDYDAEHRYDRPPVPALRAMLPDRVIYTGSVSKLLAPSLRIGWMLAPPQYKDALIRAKRLADLGNASLPQLVLAQLMDSGELERQLRYVRRRHRRRRDAIIDAIGNYLPTATVHGAAAGLHLTITFDTALDDVALARSALALGVKTQPLSWHSQASALPGLVLGYAARTPTDLTEAVATLSTALRQTSPPAD